MAAYSLSLHQGSAESRKTLEQKLFLKSALLILTVSAKAFHLINLFCCSSRYQAPTNTVDPSFGIKVFESLYDGKFTLSTQLIKPNYLVILPYDAAPQFLLKLTPLYENISVRLREWAIDRFHCHATKKINWNYPVEKATKLGCYRR